MLIPEIIKPTPILTCCDPGPPYKTMKTGYCLLGSKSDVNHPPIKLYIQIQMKRTPF